MRHANGQRWTACVLTACLWFAHVGASIASPGMLLYAADAGTQQLFNLSTTDGSPSLVGAFGVPGDMAALTYDTRNDVLYGATTATDNLYTIDRVTGAANLIGALGVSLMHGLAYNNQNGVLYGATSTNSALFRISTTTGQATLVGYIGNFIGNSNGVSGIAFNPVDSALYGCIAGRSCLGGLVRIDTSTGQGTFLCSTKPLDDLAFDPQTGTLYGIYNGCSAGATNTLWTVSIASGAATLVGVTHLANNLGLAFAPPVLPRLGTILLPPAHLRIAWPTNFANYVLESASNLPANWNRGTNSVAISNGCFGVTVLTETPQQIFRLRRP